MQYQKNSRMKKLSILIMLCSATVLFNSCKLEYVNPNGPTDEEVLNSREGLLSLCVGMKLTYATSGMQALITAPGTTSRELKGVTTFTNILELEAGGTALPTFNGNVNGLWSNMLRVMGMAENLISKAPAVLESDASTRAGVLAFGNLFKAMSIGGLATGFEQFPIQTNAGGTATFVPRAEGLQEAIRLLDEAAAAIAANAPSTEFNNRVLAGDFSLLNVINAYRARFNMMAGNYTAALTAANAVDLSVASVFRYTEQNPNPIYNQVQVAANFKARENFGLPAAMVEAGDARLNFFLADPTVVVNGENLKTLKGFFDVITKSIPVYVPDELRLIKAEAILRGNGSLTDALAEINAVRTQSAGDPVGINANLPAYGGPVTKDDLLLEVYRQRGAELFLQGLRLEDSRRFGRPAPPTNVNPVPVEFERTRNFYPYPDQERLSNPNTPQDPVI